MSITQDNIHQLREALKDLPPKPKEKFTARDAVVALAAEIHTKIKMDGYSLRDIAAQMTDSGIRISPSTLGSYLRSVTAEQEPGKATGKSRTRRGTSVQS